MKRYKLLKDLPTFNAGDEFELRDDGCLYLKKVVAVAGYPAGIGHWKNVVMAYHKRTLEQFPNILEDWFEEIKEPDEWWYIDRDGVVDSERRFEDSGYNAKKIGNYFETKEEAEEAVEKLKAWKRLRDKGFKFGGWKRDKRFYGDYTIDAQDYTTCDDADLDLLFGGEE